MVSRLKERFEDWQGRDLRDEVYAIVFLDGFHLKVRIAKRVVSVPVLAALGVAPDGQKQLLSLRPAASEASKPSTLPRETKWIRRFSSLPSAPTGRKVPYN